MQNLGTNKLREQIAADHKLKAFEKVSVFFESNFYNLVICSFTLDK
jgi:hypothetical protein